MEYWKEEEQEYRIQKAGDRIIALEEWNIGKMEYWSIGVMEYWKGGGWKITGPQWNKNATAFHGASRRHPPSPRLRRAKEDRRQNKTSEYWNDGIVERKERRGNFPDKVGKRGNLDRGAIRF